MTFERVLIAAIAPQPEDRVEIRRRARRRGFHGFVVRDALESDGPPAEEVYLEQEGTLVALQVRDGPATLAIRTVSSPEELASLSSGDASEGRAIRWASDRVIPLENALAFGLDKRPLWVYTRNVSEVPSALGALERGASRVIAEILTIDQIDALEAVLDPTPSVALPWELVGVQRVVPVGLGDRVIVDTTSILAPSEGLLVGSSAALLFHVASEAIGSKFTRPRLFRVNAGAAHSYVLLADGTTRYLSELSPGDAVLVATPKGIVRSVRVGRLKVERRPLVLVEAMLGARLFTVFLQEAETVRLSEAEERVPTTELHPGDQVYAVPFPAARHLGHVIDETIEER